METKGLAIIAIITGLVLGLSFAFDVDLHIVKAISFVVGAVAQTAFVILYGMAPWWRDFVGRALFIKSLTLAVLIDTAVVDSFLPKGIGLTYFVVLYWLVVMGICWQFVALVRQRWESHHEIEPPMDDCMSEDRTPSQP